MCHGSVEGEQLNQLVIRAEGPLEGFLEEVTPEVSFEV